jgi:hypothetical protein
VPKDAGGIDFGNYFLLGLRILVVVAATGITIIHCWFSGTNH